MALSPQHYQETAETLRRLAKALPEGQLRDELLKLASDYVLLAVRAQRDADQAAPPEPSAKPKSST